MTATAEKGFILSLFLYGISLPLSMAATNFSLALMSLCAVYLLFSREFRWSAPHSFYWLAFFLGWAFFTAWMAKGEFLPSHFKSFLKIWNVIPYILIPLGAHLLSERLEKIWAAAFWAGVFVVVLGIAAFWGGAHYFFENSIVRHALVEQKRFYGFQSHPLHTGALYSILYLMALAAALFYDRGNKSRIMSGLAAAFLGLGVALTGSRGYYLGAAAGSVALFALRGRKFLFAGVCALTLFAAVLFKADPHIENRMRTMGISRMDESSFQRIYIWKSAALMILRHPVAGVGYRHWPESLPEYAKASPDWNMTQAALSHAHNSFLTVAAETGLIGLGLFLCFWITLIKEEASIFRSALQGSAERAASAGVLSALACVLAASLTEHNLMTATLSLALFFMAGLSRCPRA